MIQEVLSPCDLQQIAQSGQCFRMQPMPDGYRILAADRCVYVQQQGQNLYFECEPSEFATFWRNYFDWDTDYAAFCAAADPNDRFLSAAVQYGGGIRILRQDLWEMIITFVISQNNNIPRIQRAVEAICERWGEKKWDSRGEVYYTFPTKQALSTASLEELRSCGLGYRDRYIQQIVHSDFEPSSLHHMDMEQAHLALCTLPGVGNKVAHCIRLFGLHDLAAFPMDTWMKKMCEKHYQGRFPVERYDGFAGVLQQYIFFYARTFPEKG